MTDYEGIWEEKKPGQWRKVRSLKARSKPPHPKPKAHEARCSVAAGSTLPAALRQIADLREKALRAKFAHNPLRDAADEIELGREVLKKICNAAIYEAGDVMTDPSWNLDYAFAFKLTVGELREIHQFLDRSNTVVSQPGQPLPTGDNECVWMEIKPADRELIRRSPELMAALEDLMQIVEGVRNERWAADGRRLKDTPEWCRLYVLRCAILRGEPNNPVRHEGAQPRSCL